MANIPEKITNSFVIGKKIGSGAFGDAYRAKRNDRPEEITIKFEDINAQTQYLENEVKVILYHNMKNKNSGTHQNL